MPVHDYEQMADALVYNIYTKGGASYSLVPKQMYGLSADYFELTEMERNEQRPDGRPGKFWEDRVQWTRQRLINEGYLDG